MVSPKTNCAGQSCPERDACRRYVSLIAEGFKSFGRREVPIFAWASFDLERKAFGDCPQRLRVVS